MARAPRAKALQRAPLDMTPTINALNELIAEGFPDFQTAQPLTMTVLERSGRYSQVGVIGGEKMLLTKVYAGKRVPVVFCFEPIGWERSVSGAENVIQVEVAIGKIAQVSGLGAWLELKTGLTAAAIAEGKLAHRSKGAQASATLVPDNDAEWGTW